MKLKKQLENLASIKKLDNYINESDKTNQLMEQAIKRAEEKYFDAVIENTDNFFLLDNKSISELNL